MNLKVNGAIVHIEDIEWLMNEVRRLQTICDDLQLDLEMINNERSLK